MIPLTLALIALSLPTPAQSHDRTVMLTSFDRVRVEGPFDVTLTTGKGAGGVLSGDARAIDGVNLRVEGRTLIVSAGANGWGGYPGDASGPVTIRVTTPSLRTASVAGGGHLRIDRMRGQAIELAVGGAGVLSVAAIEADQLNATLNGTGALTLVGNAGRARFVNSGTGAIDAGGLVARDLIVMSQGMGSGAYHARYTADISAMGLGSIAVGGSPKCTVRGPGPVACGP